MSRRTPSRWRRRCARLAHLPARLLGRSSLDSVLAYKRHGRQLAFEALEERHLLAVDLVGVPDWIVEGSQPMISASSVSDPSNPASGGVEDLAVDASNPARIFLGTVNGGIWRTANGNAPFNGVDDDGVNGVDDPAEQPDWEPLTDEFASLAIGDIRFDPIDATRNTLFAGTGSASSLSGAGGTAIGVMRTTDGGDTWSVVRLNPGGAEPQVRAVLPTTFDANGGVAGVQQVVLVGANSNTGLYRSADGGQSYTAISGTNGLPTGAVTQIIADPNNASQYFAGVVGQGVFRSVDGGLNWTPVNTNLTNLATSSLVEVAAHPNGGTTRLYAMVSGFTGSNAAGTLAAVRTAVFTSTNGGNSWTALAAVPAGFDSSRPDLFTGMAADQLVIDPTNPLIVYIAKGYGGSPILYRYNPAAGGSWVLIDSAGASGGTRPHVDSRDLQFAGSNVLIHANDGGIYFLRNPQDAANNRWTSLHGSGATGLGATEYHNVAWDSTFNVIFGGAQDNGTSVQNSAGNVVWTQFQGSDGGDVVVDTVNAGAGQVFRYASTQNLGVLNRYTFNSATGIVGGSTVDLMPAGGLTNFNAPFVPHYELNTVTPARLVTGASGNNPGTSPVYELLNAATAANAAAANWQAVPIGAGFVGVNRGTLVYGGRSGGVDNAEVLLAGSGSGVFVRSTAGGMLTATPTAFPGGAVQDIAVDPQNWRHFFVADASGVFETPDAGATWTNLTRNLGLVNSTLESLAFIPTAGLGAIAAGGHLGVSKLLLDGATEMWTRFGADLPNAVVDDLVYNATDDVLLAGTFGRGAFTVDSASLVADDDGVLHICGDEQFVNQDDVIRLVRNAMNPLILDVFLNSVAPVFSVALALVNQINVFGVGGNDTLIVDSTNGLINVPEGIRYDGDGLCPDGEGSPPFGYDRGIDTLEVRQTGGTVHASDTITVGATIGSGISTVVGVGAGNVQTIFFEELEPIIDNVPAAAFNINGALIGSLLHAANQITYSDSDLFDATWARVTVDAFEPIHFTSKQVVTIDAENGDDVVVLNKATRPTALTQLQVLGDIGADVVRILAVPDAVGGFTGVQALGGAGNDLLDGSQSSADAPLTLLGEAGNDTLLGGASNDVLRGDANDDTLVDSPDADVFDGGAGNDVLLIQGTDAGDLIDVFQVAPTAVVGDNYDLAVNNTPVAGPFVAVVDEITSTNAAQAPNNSANRPTVERIRIAALAGGDVLRAGHADVYGDTSGANGVAAQTLAIAVEGDAPNASDRLAVRDDGLGDLVIQRLGADSRSGSFTVGGMAPIDYAGIEFANVLPLNPLTGGTGTDGLGRLVVFKNDPFETNDSLATAWFLGAGVAVNADPTIDPAGFDFPPVGPDPFDIPGDNDFFRFVAQETGTLDFQVYFTPVGTLANGRAGLPGNGELTVTVFDANGLPLAVGTAADLLDDNDTPAAADDVKIGERIAIPVVRNRTYFLRVTGQTANAVNVYNFTAINVVAPIPQLVDLQAASDSGRHNSDDVTRITTPTFDIVLDDARIDEFTNQNLNPDTVNDDAATQLDGGGARIDYGVEVFSNGVSIGFAFFTGVGATWRFTATAGDLAEGANNFISAAVWIRDASLPVTTATISRHDLSAPLQVTLDTVTPPGSFGLPDAASVVDGLAADSDSGVVTVPATFADRATSDTTPRLWGRAEANAAIRVFLDRDDDGVIDLATDTFLGLTVANPFDGNDAYPDGYWELTSALDLNEVPGLPRDGLRRLLVTAEDVAGNPAPAAGVLSDGVDELQIFIDTQGPQIAAVTVNDLTPAEYDLFDPKPVTTGPTPLVHSLSIAVVDQPNRVDSALAINDFLYEALVAGVASAPGNYVLRGDRVGLVPIQSVTVTNDPRVGGAPATATITLNFFAPLADDRYTLTVRDNLVDPVNNRLDGESNAAEPLEDPLFPTGDGVPGGEFLGRFTVDSRAEIASVIAQQINVDINGNAIWDPGTVPTGGDSTHVDLTFTMQVADPLTGAHAAGGFGVHDLVFAGKFGSRGGLLVGDNAVFIIDVSGSTAGAFGGDPVGDANNDGFADTILDAEIAALKLLNQQLIDRGLGATAQVAIVPFSSGASNLDMNPLLAGVQLTTTPLADANANGMRDVEEALMSLLDGGGTNFEAPLQQAIATIGAAGIPAGDGNVIFLSDGFGSGSFDDEVFTLRETLGMNLRAFGVGPGASLAQLSTIDPAAATFSNTNELLAAFGGGAGGGAGGAANGFDTLAVYGNAQDLGGFRWLVDRNSDGVINTAEGDILSLQPAQAGFDVAGALPLAGNFDRNSANGDEIGLYKFGTWILDRDRDFVIETNGDDTVITGTLLGHPVVGDFDRDGFDDFGVFNNNTWQFDMAFDGLGATNANGFGADAAGGDRDDSFIWGFPGVLDRPVAADMDRDGVDDLGLWVPRSNAQNPVAAAEWYFLVSHQVDASGVPTVGAVQPGTVNTLDHPYKTPPFGFDLYAEFGYELAMPLVGNFDPPVTATPLPVGSPSPGPGVSADFDADGDVDGADFLALQRGLGRSQAAPSQGDSNGDRRVDAGDLGVWRESGAAAPTPSAADLDLDGDVDGADFLRWQRGPATAVGLAAWRANFGAIQASTSAGAAASTAAATDPTGAVASYAAYGPLFASDPAPATVAGEYGSRDAALDALVANGFRHARLAEGAALRISLAAAPRPGAEILYAFAPSDPRDADAPCEEMSDLAWDEALAELGALAAAED